MAVTLPAFVAGLGVLVTLDVALLAVSVENARKVGTDTEARQAAAEAEEQAQYAHQRLQRHLANDHDKQIEEP